MSFVPPARPSKHFTSVQSAQSAVEELAIKDEDRWNNEVGHITSSTGLVVATPGSDFPYKVILTHLPGKQSEHPFSTMREAEAFIRRSTPLPAPHRTLYDRPAEAG
jgi:hypothetical protein